MGGGHFNHQFLILYDGKLDAPYDAFAPFLLDGICPTAQRVRRSHYQCRRLQRRQQSPGKHNALIQVSLLLCSWAAVSYFEVTRSNTRSLSFTFFITDPPNQSHPNQAPTVVEKPHASGPDNNIMGGKQNVSGSYQPNVKQSIFMPLQLLSSS